MLTPVIERSLWKHGYKRVAGIDEAGRGAFAGPLVAAAVIFGSAKTVPEGLDDSKKLTPKKRTAAARLIIKTAEFIGFGRALPDDIDQNGITWATQKVFSEAILELKVLPDFILADAYRVNHLEHICQKAIIRGDQQVASIAAASIMAKVYRDWLMAAVYQQEYPKYQFEKHKGYGTRRHRELILEYGPCAIHRRSFLKKMLNGIPDAP